MPGQNARHPEGAFEDVTRTARPGMTPAALAASEAWRTGWRYLETGYFWEAHELFEPVWRALPPNLRARAFVQGAIQIANAALKARMGRPRAVLRLCDLAQAHLDAAGVLGAAAMQGDRDWLVSKGVRMRAVATRALEEDAK
ncbi:DUF309 domain-containing protein [Antarcticimicrobium sediminis]|uniref:DUF309 domain-containing protein n=1 Tax=Antarcticimicrobium sediminis TaxID=2546227 RepID=A0A4R5EMY9_9RHOB|nr:DUF309 domain-containing protein [Antarcticimicrobium sediminis]TDE35954.1 DUF309 domain-containing protein [Antarcticimicrobium sediminis]